MGFILTVIGVLLVIEGIPYFAFPKKVKGWSLSIQEVPDKNLRILGLVSMLIGLLTIFIIKVVI